MSAVPRLLIISCLLLTAFAGCLDRAPVTQPGWGEDATEKDVAPGVDDADLSRTGRWLQPFDGEVPAVNMVVLHDGRVLYWSGLDASEGATETDILGVAGPYPAQGESRLLEFTEDGPVITTPAVPDGGGFDLFCSGQTVLADGRVVIAGGTEWEWIPDGTVGIRGVPDARIFDPATSSWSLTTDMNLGRWYPSLITDDQGDVLSIGGIGHWVDPNEHWPSWETYDHNGTTWTAVPGTDERVLPLYARTYQVAGGPLKGQFFTDTVGSLWAPFGEHPDQADWSYQWAFDADTGAWTNLGLSSYGARSYAGNVMLPLEPDRDYAPQFITTGGSLYQSGVGVALTETTDLATDPPTRRTLPDMNTARWHPMMALMLDGDILTIGGSVYDNVVFYSFPTMPPIHDVEVFHTETETWTQVDPMSVERVYHSTLALLPDGRMLAGGHVPDPNYFGAGRKYVNPQPYETRLEIYEPGYLFRGDRPIIQEAPGELEYATEFTVDVDLPADLDSFLLVRPAATTHTYDGSVRHIRLETVDQTNGTVTLTAPPDSVVAPPGHYMLFALSTHPDGPVPSEAVWVHID